MKQTAESVQEQVDALIKDGIDKIVLLSHSGTKADLELVPKLSGVDIVVSGHDHAVFGDPPQLASAGLGAKEVARAIHPYPVVAKGKDGRTVLVVSAGEWGQIVGRIDVDFDAQGIVTSWRGQPLVVRCDGPHTCAEDSPLGREVEKLMAPVHTVSDRILTKLPHAMPSSSDGESELGKQMADAMLDAARPLGATIAIAEGDFRAGLPSGDVTYGVVYEAWPFLARIIVVDLTGAELAAFVERWLKSDEVPPQVSGIRINYTLPPSAPHASARLDDITVVGPGPSTRLNPGQHYKVALDHYLVRLAPDKEIREACERGGCAETHVLQREALAEHLARGTSSTGAPRLVRR